MLRKVFGIPSWLPDKEPDRSQRKERINRLFKQLNDLWPNIDILVVAQNWQDFKPIKTKNKQIIKTYEPLGILKARQTLREEFLKLDYDYIIMFDDDAIIEFIDNTPKQYMNEIEKHPHGFCFMPGNNSKYHPYCGAQLNLCAISRFIYEQEPMVPVDPQKDEGYEDSIFACLLYHKYRQYEFKPPVGIKCIQFQNIKEKVPSTWAEDKQINFALISANTNLIQDYIVTHHSFPQHFKDFIRKPYKPPEKVADGKKDCYLYF